MNDDKLKEFQGVANLIRLDDYPREANTIEELIAEVRSLQGLLDEAIRVLEQNNTSNHPSARALITTMSPTFRDFRGCRESENRKAKEPPMERFKD